MNETQIFKQRKTNIQTKEMQIFKQRKNKYSNKGNANIQTKEMQIFKKIFKQRNNKYTNETMMKRSGYEWALGNQGISAEFSRPPN